MDFRQNNYDIIAISIREMKKEFLKILLFAWMVASIYFLYEIWIDINWIADAVHTYIKMVMEHVRH